MAPFRKQNESQSQEALDYCSRADILADHTPLSELSPGFIKYKVGGVVTSIPHEVSQFKKKLWSWLIIITDPSLEVFPNGAQEEEVREMKAHLFSNEMNAYPEVHRGDVVLLKQVQCEYSPFGDVPKPVDIRIFSSNDFTVLCCHSEIQVEDSEPRPQASLSSTNNNKRKSRQDQDDEEDGGDDGGDEQADDQGNNNNSKNKGRNKNNGGANNNAEEDENLEPLRNYPKPMGFDFTPPFPPSRAVVLAQKPKPETPEDAEEDKADGDDQKDDKNQQFVLLLGRIQPISDISEIQNQNQDGSDDADEEELENNKKNRRG